jgi:hypothetical protein
MAAPLVVAPTSDPGGNPSYLLPGPPLLLTATRGHRRAKPGRRLVVLVAAVPPVLLVVLQSTKLGWRGGGPGSWKSCWLMGMPGTLMLTGFLGCVDGVGPTSQVVCRWYSCCEGDNRYPVWT